jgi:hypothetical protein
MKTDKTRENPNLEKTQTETFQKVQHQIKKPNTR